MPETGPENGPGRGVAGASVVLTGAGGMLARAMVPALDAAGARLTALDEHALDITDPAAAARTIPAGTAYVVNCAAYTNVDGAEADEPAARAVNALGPANLAARCAEIGATLIHISTDYVFDGRTSSPYRIDEPLRPLGAYGRTKAEGEERILASGASHLIVRTSWLYAPWGKNFVLTIASLARQKESLRVVHDQRGRPTSAEGLAATIVVLLERGARGVLHATDGGECTWFELAAHVVRTIGAPCRVEPCTTAEFPRPAPRPAYSVLDLSETEALIGPMTPWPDAVARALEKAENA